MNIATKTLLETPETKHGGQLFDQSSAYKEHEQPRTGVKSYTCQHCQKRFPNFSNCKRHERIHTGVKPYTCKYCKKGFTQSSACKEHEQSHTGVKPYTCKHCKKGFPNFSNCKRHERTHTGEKPYTCKHDCKKSFSRSSKCRQHEERHVRASSLKQKQHDYCFKSSRDLQEPAAILGGKKSCILPSLTEENSSLTCWICLKEFNCEACVIKHYDEHMRTK